jgi:hypothetical protein
LTRCAHCGIEFLTDPRNAGRTNLRCPFGCRRHHRRQCSGRRSAAYYRTPSGRGKKKRLNGRRGLRPAEHELSTAPVESPAPPPAAPATLAARSDEAEPELRLEDVALRASHLSSSPLLPYARLLVRLIEGFVPSRRELVELLARALRQRSLAFRSRRDYVLAFLHQHPP